MRSQKFVARGDTPKQGESLKGRGTIKGGLLLEEEEILKSLCSNFHQSSSKVPGWLMYPSWPRFMRRTTCCLG